MLEHQDLQTQTLGLLITHYWVSEEAKRVGIRVTGRDVRREEAHASWAKRARRFLLAAGVQPPDERFVIEGRLLLTKLQRRTLPVYAKLRRSARPETAQMAAEVDAEIQELSDAMTRRWAPRTRCRSGFVVSQCSEYTASSSP